MIDSGAKTDKFASFLTTNNVAGGKAAAVAMAACIKERTGKVAGKVASSQLWLAMNPWILATRASKDGGLP